MATTSNAPARTNNSNSWFRRNVSRDVSPKLFVIQIGLSIAAIVIIFFGITLSSLGDTIDLQYGLFLDRWTGFVFVGALLMTAIPAFLALKQKDWLRLIILLAMLILMTPLFFSYILLLLTGIGKVLAPLVIPMLIGPFLHAVAVYWVGFQGVSKSKTEGAQRELDRCNQVVNDTEARAEGLQRESDAAQQAAKATEKRVTSAKKALKTAETAAEDARKAHEKHVKNDKDLSEAQREFGFAERELSVRERAMIGAHEQLMKMSATSSNYSKAETLYRTKQNDYEEYRLNEYQAAADKLEAAQRAANNAPTLQEKERTEQAVQDRATELRNLEAQLETEKQVHASKQASAGAAAEAVKKAKTAARKAKDKHEAAQARQKGQRNSWLLTSGVLLLVTFLCYAAVWGRIANLTI